jgi:hypothetical protein
MSNLIAGAVLAMLSEFDREPLEGALVHARHNAFDDESRE